MSYETILTERLEGGVGLVTLNRPDALNALSEKLVDELGEALQAFDSDDGIGAVVITGSERAFAAGADIKEMKDQSFADAYGGEFITRNWDAVARIRKPTVAAVAGYALGGGCELAMMCDIILAADNAKFGQPEINLGVIPGSGGTQRLTRAVGKSKAMDMCLTGRMMDAAEAERSGLVSRIYPAESLVEEAVGVARIIAAKGRLSVYAAKEAVDASFEVGLAAGVRLERRLFHALFATDDQKEGMSAFADKRKAEFRHR